MMATRKIQPPVVRHGIISLEDWNRLVELFQDEDWEGWARMARNLCRDNYQLWCVLVHGWDPMPHFFEAEELVKVHDKLLIEVSRGMAKSYRWSIAEIAHDIAYSTVPGSGYEDPRILLIQESMVQAKETLLAIKALFESGGQGNVLRLMFPDFWDQVDSWSPQRVSMKGRTSKEPTVMVTGIGGSMVGMHPKKIIGDDMVSNKNSRTPAARRNHRKWWYETVNGMMMEGTKVRCLFTPYYEDDLHGVLKEDPTYKHIRMAALNRQPTKEDYEEIFDVDGMRSGVRITDKGMDLKALWPCPLGTGRCPGTKAHYEEYGYHASVEYLINEKYLPDPVSFSSQQMLKIVSASEQRIKEDMLRFYSIDNSQVGKLTEYNDYPIVPFPDKADIDACVHAWDHAIGTKKQHDRTGFSRAYRTKDNRVFFINRAGRWGFRRAIKMMEENFKTDPIKRPMVIASEGIGFQQAYSEVLKEESKEILPVECIKMYMDKDTALVESGLLSHFVNGMVYVDVNDKDTIDELLNFTPEQRFHDDLLDAMRIAFHVIRRRIKRKARVFSRRR